MIVLAEGDIYRDYLFRIQQRMSALSDPQPSLFVDLRLHGPHVAGEAALGEHHVQLEQDILIRPDLKLRSSDPGAELSQDPLDLLLLCELQLPQLVVHVDDGLRLDEQGRSRRGLVVDYARHPGLVLQLYRDHITAVPHGDDGILKVCLVLRRSHDLLDLGSYRLVDPQDVAPDAAKLRTGAVRHLVLRKDAAGDLVLKAL